MFAVEFNIKGDEVEIVALDNAYTDPVDVWVCLDYGFAVKYLTINIGIGRPLEIKQFYHFIDEYVGYIEVPANSAVSATLYVTYTKLKTGYSAEVGFPNIDMDWIVRGTLEVMQPIDYKLEISALHL